MGGGARPWSVFAHRCCLVLCTAAMTGMGAAEVGAQTGADKLTRTGVCRASLAHLPQVRRCVQVVRRFDDAHGSRSDDAHGQCTHPERCAQHPVRAGGRGAPGERKPERSRQQQHADDRRGRARLDRSCRRPRTLSRARRRRQPAHHADGRGGRRPKHPRRPLHDRHRPRDRPDQFLLACACAARSARSTTRSSTSPSCSTRRSISSCAPIPPSRRSTSSPGVRSISATPVKRHAVDRATTCSVAWASRCAEVNMAGTATRSRGLEAGDIDAVALIGGKPVPTVAHAGGLRLLAASVRAATA